MVREKIRFRIGLNLSMNEYYLGCLYYIRKLKVFSPFTFNVFIFYLSCVICSNVKLLCATLGFWISRKLQESAGIPVQSGLGQKPPPPG